MYGRGGFVEIWGVLLCYHPGSPQHSPSSQGNAEWRGTLGRGLDFFLRKRPKLALYVRLAQGLSLIAPVHRSLSTCLSKPKLVINVMVTLGWQGLDRAMAPADGSGPSLAWPALFSIQKSSDSD